MEKSFEELAYCKTQLGELILRRRKIPMLDDQIVYEVILNDEFLMSSLFHAAEDALAEIALREIDASELDVVVGGLGLGYTGKSVLCDKRVRSLRIVEFLKPVIDWHREGLLPVGTQLADDPRCRLVEGDFFTLATNPDGGFDSSEPDRLFHAILLDIDHSHEHLLAPHSAAFYSTQGLGAIAQRLLPDGIFGMWADGAPSDSFLNTLRSVFPQVRAEIVTFPNPIRDNESSSTVYIARKKKW